MHHTDNPDLIIKDLEAGKNLFITGKAGAGKSYLIQKFLSKTNRNCVVCATTGIAALAINGETIHRFLKLGIYSRIDDGPEIISKWEDEKERNPDQWDVLDKMECLIIDEVSMLRRDQLELIDDVLRNLFLSHLPFGGKQIVLVGDMLQLPPVVKQDELSIFPDMKYPYVFQSVVWRDAKFECYNLTTSYRQSDKEFLDALNEIRIGKVSRETDKLMKSRVKAPLKTKCDPVKIFNINRKVDAYNKERLRLLNSPKHKFLAIFTGSEHDINCLKKDCIAEEELIICNGAQIMMLQNDPDDRWVNGSIGVVSEIHNSCIRVSIDSMEYSVEQHTWERRKPLVNNKGKIEWIIVATMTQYPLKLAYIFSTHKSQGSTIEYASIDLSRTFAPGQAYTALSRCKTLSGLSLEKWNKKAVFADKEVLRFYGYIEDKSTSLLVHQTYKEIDLEKNLFN